MQLTIATATLTITALTSTLVSAQLNPIRITGIPHGRFPSPAYIEYAPNFFGDKTLQPTSNKSNAVYWTTTGCVGCDLISGSGLTIGLHAPYQLPSAQTIEYVAYDDNEGTYVDGDGQVLNHGADFESWQFCESQYGANLGYVTPGYNTSNAGKLFPCYLVKFVLES